MIYCYSSKLKNHIEQMVKQKHALGSPYIESERILFSLIGFVHNFILTQKLLLQTLEMPGLLSSLLKNLIAFKTE